MVFGYFNNSFVLAVTSVPTGLRNCDIFGSDIIARFSGVAGASCKNFEISLDFANSPPFIPPLTVILPGEYSDG